MVDPKISTYQKEIVYCGNGDGLKGGQKDFLNRNRNRNRKIKILLEFITN
jgi:hypothetical protein